MSFLTTQVVADSVARLFARWVDPAPKASALPGDHRSHHPDHVVVESPTDNHFMQEDALERITEEIIARFG